MIGRKIHTNWKHLGPCNFLVYLSLVAWYCTRDNILLRGNEFRYQSEGHTISRGLQRERFKFIDKLADSQFASVTMFPHLSVYKYIAGKSIATIVHQQVKEQRSHSISLIYSHRMIKTLCSFAWMLKLWAVLSSDFAHYFSPTYLTTLFLSWFILS